MVVEADIPGAQLNPQTNRKEIWLDPGVRFCPFGHLAWYHLMAGGLREMENGTSLASTPAPHGQNRAPGVGPLTPSGIGGVFSGFQFGRA